MLKATLNPIQTDKHTDKQTQTNKLHLYLEKLTLTSKCIMFNGHVGY